MAPADKSLRSRLIILLVLLFAGSIAVSGHVPIGTVSNEQLSTATKIPDPQKSFVIYSELHEGGEAQYYHFTMGKGQVLSGTMQVPGPDSMVPDLVVIGPGIISSGEAPSFVEIPPGSQAMIIRGSPPGPPSYEPFSPAAIYEVARFRTPITVDGDYYIAVFGTGGGKYSLAPGFIEEFSPAEWIMVPISTISIHLWEGQSLAAILLPFAIVVIAGVFLVFSVQKRDKMPADLIAWAGSVSGLLYLGGAAITSVQAIRAVSIAGFSPSAIITLIFIAGPVILGIAAIRITLAKTDPKTPTWRKGAGMMGIGLLGLLSWAGLVFGPVLAMISGALILVRDSMKKDHA
jgi:hypothetical protein